MKTKLSYLVAALLAFFAAGTAARAQDKAALGSPAPDFTLVGSDGKEHKLSSYTGKPIVLEWTNPGCPFVRKWYEPKEMQKLQKEATSAGVVWLRINSSAPGKQGAQTPPEAAAYEKEQGVAATLTLLDPEGKVGHLYGAKTTPNMFIIDAKGTLVYAGAIDSKPSVNSADIPEAKNYVTAALADLAAGKPVATPSTTAYGCSVKYSDKK